MGIWKRPDGGRKPWRATFPHPVTRKTVRAPGGFATKGAAIAWRDSTRAEILASGGGYDPQHGRLTFDAFRRLVWQPQRQVGESTAARDRSLMPRLTRWDDWPLVDIRPSHVRAWARDLASSETPNVAWHTLSLFRGILQLAKDDGRIPSNPADGASVPTPPPHEDRTLTDDEVALIIAAMPWPGYRVFTELLAGTGLRWSECAALPERLADHSRKLVRVRWTIDRHGRLHEYVKGSAGAAFRDVPLTDALDEVLTTWLKIRPDTPDHDAGGKFLFVGPRGKPLQYQNFLANAWRLALSGAHIAEPLPTPHDLRHYYGTKLGEAGIGEANIGALLGHAPNSRITRRYVQPTQSRLDQARDVFDR